MADEKTDLTDADELADQAAPAETAPATAGTSEVVAPTVTALGVDLPDAVFGQPPNRAVMPRASGRQAANARQGPASTRPRSLVRGGGAKPYRQKGTGRARHGSLREPSMV